MEREDIRLAIPSNGRLERDALAFMEACGLAVHRRDDRQYTATVPALPGLTAVWQRQNDIVRGIALGSLDLAIVGQDALDEQILGPLPADPIVVLHDELDISHCELFLAVPQAWHGVETMSDLTAFAGRLSQEEGRSLRVATKYPRLTGKFLEQNHIHHELVKADGTLEIAPSLGYADMIADLVSSGTTLRANQLRPITDGLIIHSQGVLIANRHVLKNRPEVLQITRDLLEFFEAYLRAQNCYTVVANMRGRTPEEISRKMFDHPHIRGLQGPTISPVIPHHGTPTGETNWFAVQIVVKKDDMSAAIRELRAIGGSGVIVTPVRYIFEEEPARFKQMIERINN